VIWPGEVKELLLTQLPPFRSGKLAASLLSCRSELSIEQMNDRQLLERPAGKLNGRDGRGAAEVECESGRYIGRLSGLINDRKKSPSVPVKLRGCDLNLKDVRRFRLAVLLGAPTDAQAKPWETDAATPSTCFSS
jgi:hypothetical protein